jgi:hypothetical protein
METFKVLVVKGTNITIICDVVLCSLAHINHRFKGLYSLRLEGTMEMEAVDSSKMLVYLHPTRRCHVADDNDDDDDDNTMMMTTMTTTTKKLISNFYFFFFFKYQ